jgi:hypothetical protein
LDQEKRISEFEIKIEDVNERSEKIKIKIIIILNDRFRNLETENKKLNDIIKNRDRIIINFNNQIAILKRERTEFRRIFDMRDNTIAYQANELNFFSIIYAPIIKGLISRI